MREHVQSSEVLQDAFETFNEQSLRLQDSYQSLEALVALLSAELQTTQTQRLSELAEKERLAERLTILLNALPAGVIVIDHLGVIQEINSAVTALVGDCKIGQPFNQIIPDVTLDSIQDSSELTLPSGKIIAVSRKALDADNSTILLINDVTDRVTLEKLINHQERLSSMGEMIAKLAHQLRTPLSSALLYASHLESAQLSEKQRVDFAHCIHEGLHKLDRMINDMLVFSRNDTTGEDCISVLDLLAEVEKSLRPQLVKAHARWLVNCDQDSSFILGNHSLLTGALSNLVMNAIHASDDGVLIQWDVRHDNETIYLSIQDNGSGIKTEFAQDVFEPFFTTRKNGTGLGLAVVRTVIQAHKGKIDIDKTSEQGTRFLITLPYLNKNGLLASNTIRGHLKQNSLLEERVSP